LLPVFTGISDARPRAGSKLLATQPNPYTYKHGIARIYREILMSSNPRSQQRAILSEDGELREILETPQSRLSAIYCIHCGTANRPEARFCYQCGQSVEDQHSDTMGTSMASLHKAKRSAMSELRQAPPSPSLSVGMMVMEAFTALFVLGSIVSVSVTRSSMVPFILFAWIVVTWIRYRRR
jgi:hypothetical protein